MINLRHELHEIIGDYIDTNTCHAGVAEDSDKIKTVDLS